MRRYRDAPDLSRPAIAGRPCVQGRLQVDMFERRQVAGDNGMIDAVRTEKIAHERRDFVDLLPGTRMNPVQEAAERGSEVAGFVVGRFLRHGNLQPVPARPELSNTLVAGSSRKIGTALGRSRIGRRW